MYCNETAAITDVTKARHITSVSLAKVSNSSKPNSTPPKGLPNATEMPAAAAAARIRRL